MSRDRDRGSSRYLHYVSGKSRDLRFNISE
jgi:hypothetical protein